MARRRLEEVASADQPVGVVAGSAQLFTGAIIKYRDGLLIGLLDFAENVEVAGDSVVGTGGPGVTGGVKVFCVQSVFVLATRPDVVVVQVEGPLIDGVRSANTDLGVVVGLLLIAKT